MNRITSGICAISASLALSLCLTACSSEPSDEVASQAGSAAGKVVSQAEDSAKKASEIKIGETITVPDRYEITFTDYEWLDEIKVKSDSVTFNIKQKSDGITYLVLKGTLKNLSNHRSNLSGSPCGIENSFLINDQYEYRGDKVAYGNNASCDLSVDPLMTVNYCVYAAVPNEVKENFTGAKVTLRVNEEDVPNDNIPKYTLGADPIATYVISIP